MAVSGVSSHLNQLLGSALAREFQLVHFQVGSEGRSESVIQKLKRFLVSPWQLWRLLSRHRPCIVHINTSMVPKAYWRDTAYLVVSKLAGCKVVYQVHGGEFPREFCKGNLIRISLLKGVLRAADVVVLLSQSARAAYVAFDPRVCVRVAPNAIEVGEEVPAKVRDPAVPLRLVYLGRLVANKGLFDTVEALALLRNMGIEANMTFAGTGPDESRLMKRVDELGLADRVVFKGTVRGPAKNALWREADVLVFPTYHLEGLPYTLLEGMAARAVPVICPVGGIPEAMEHGKQGLFVPPKDPTQLAGAIQRLHDNRAELDEMACAGRERVLDRYTVRRLAGDFADIYSNL
jgi:glycosyltransferase involved in cell wall biosynthesis